MDVSWTYCGHHVTIYVNQAIMLYALILYSDVCQLFLNKTGKKPKEKGKQVHASFLEERQHIKNVI